MKILLTITILLLLASCRKEQEPAVVRFSGTYQHLNKYDINAPFIPGEINITIWGDSAIVIHSLSENRIIDTAQVITHTETELVYILPNGCRFAFDIKDDSIRRVVDFTRYIMTRVKDK